MAIASSCRKIEVLLTADRILGALQDAQAPLSVTDLTRLTGMSTDMVFRQMGTMEEMRWVDRIGDRYVIGMRLAVFWARRKSMTDGLIQRAQNELVELAGGGE